MSKQRTTVLCSGGLDSLVLSYQLAQENHALRLLYLNLGKKCTDNEMAAVKAAALRLDAPLEIVLLEGLTKMQLGYLPTAYVLADELDTGSHPSGAEIRAFHITVNVGLHYAAITKSTVLALGVIGEQLAGVPGLKEFFSIVSKPASLLNPDIPAINVLTPFIDKPKSHVVTLGASLGVNFEESWTCYFGGDLQCGDCTNCKSRKKAFAEAKITDPTRYRA